MARILIVYASSGFTMILTCLLLLQSPLPVHSFSGTMTRKETGVHNISVHYGYTPGKSMIAYPSVVLGLKKARIRNGLEAFDGKSTYDSLMGQENSGDQRSILAWYGARIFLGGFTFGKSEDIAKAMKSRATLKFTKDEMITMLKFRKLSSGQIQVEESSGFAKLNGKPNDRLTKRAVFTVSGFDPKAKKPAKQVKIELNEISYQLKYERTTPVNTVRSLAELKK